MWVGAKKMSGDKCRRSWQANVGVRRHRDTTVRPHYARRPHGVNLRVLRGFDAAQPPCSRALCCVTARFWRHALFSHPVRRRKCAFGATRSNLLRKLLCKFAIPRIPVCALAQIQCCSKMSVATDSANNLWGDKWATLWSSRQIQSCSGHLLKNKENLLWSRFKSICGTPKLI